MIVFIQDLYQMHKAISENNLDSTHLYWFSEF